MSEERIADIRSRSEQATDGPWDYVTQGLVCRASQSSEDAVSNPLAQAYLSEEDGAFIAHARDDIPFLLGLLAERDHRIANALDYCADTTSGDWQISYHEAVQRLRQILRGQE